MTSDPIRTLRHLPAWHAVAPAQHWMNDPNGLWRDSDGRWHLWFQYRDDPPTYSRTHWGRLVSTDGLVWRDAGIDFAADADSDIYSGCVVEVDGAVQRAYITRHRHGRGGAGALPPPSAQQAVEIWQRDSRHAGWRAAPTATRVDPGLRDFRDPFVFRFGSGWRMLVAEPCPWDAAAEGPSRSRLQVWRSADGLHWEPTGAIGPWDPPRVMWEVPQLLPLSALQAPASGASPEDGALWLLLVSVLDRRSGTTDTADIDIACSVRWHLGTFDGARFEPVADSAAPVSTAAQAAGRALSGRLLDHGPDFYAACLQTPAFAQPAGPAVVAWMSNWAYARRLPLPGFAGGPMTLPRQLAWVAHANDNGLRQQPIATLDRARCGSPHVTPMQELSGMPCTVARALGSLDLEIRLHMAAGGQAWLRLAEPGPPLPPSPSPPSQTQAHSQVPSQAHSQAPPQAPSPSSLPARSPLPSPTGGDAAAPLVLHIDALARRITLHRAPLVDADPAPGFAGAWPAAWTPDVSGGVAIRLLLDGCCAEIFVDAGAVVFSALVFLPAGAVCTLSAQAGAQVQLLGAQAWPISA